LRIIRDFKVKLAAAWFAAAAALGPALAAPLGPPDDKRGGAPISERFPSLDAYLAYLEKRSHMDGPWYREVRPGVYELQTGNLRLPDGEIQRRTFTREELEKKFGFAR
jgi:hypothetical protein